MAEIPPGFVKWKEVFVSQERGSRVVHYYLEDAAGSSHLAVIGKERSLRHMLYVVSDEFGRTYWSEKLGASGLKWRSRREVVDWLASFLPAKTNAQRMEVTGYCDNGCYHFKQSSKGHNSDIMWSGDSWTCGKRLRHYRAFCRNGIKIVIHSFVLVMSEEENRYFAYLEDMYEDRKGQKKVKVRWFHQNQELACTIPPPAPHPSEVFITPLSQVISAECVDDVATILTPEHYEKCLSLLPSSSGICLCFRQFNKNKFKLFDLRTLCGYFSQTVLLRLDICSVSEQGEEKLSCSTTTKQDSLWRISFDKDSEKCLKNSLARKGVTEHITTSGPANKNLGYNKTVERPLSVKFVKPLSVPSFDVGEKIEFLCQDSGIRGCWFKCTVLQLSHKRLRVQYDDVQSVDGCGNLEEWIPAYKPAVPDRLGMRCPGRLTIRPYPTCIYLHEKNVSLENGMAVDACWYDGWWEGILVGTGSSRDGSLQVYLPGEGIFLMCKMENLRISKDWIDNQWVDINLKPEILSIIPSFSTAEKLPTWSDSGLSAMSNHEMDLTDSRQNRILTSKPLLSPGLYAMSDHETITMPVKLDIVDGQQDKSLADKPSLSSEYGAEVHGKKRQRNEEGDDSDKVR